MRVADYVVQFLLEKGIIDTFSVVGGGSMFLNDAFAKTPGMHCTYNHHEQACTMAAEAYYKYKNKINLLLYLKMFLITRKHEFIVNIMS